MHKKVLVCLPLNDAHRAALEASVPEFEFRFNALDDVHAEDVLWADVVLGNAPVSMIRQNKHIEWFQSNSAGPDAYLKPGVLPENCMVTNATGAYGLAISEWMLAMWLGIQKDMFLYRDRQNQRQWAPIDRPVRGITGARVLCVGMGDIGSNFARRAHMLGAEVVGVRRTVHPDTPCPDYCLRVVAQSQLDEELPEADLTETEYKILKLLMQSPQRIFPVQVIYETVWGEPYFYVSNGTVMVHIRNLRMKVEHNPQNPQRICTVWGKGYRFAAQEDGNGNT